MDKEFPTIVWQMEEGEGGRDWRSGKKKWGSVEGGGWGRRAGFTCLRLYISPGFGNQTQEKPTASKSSGGPARITYFPPAQTFTDDSRPFIYVVFLLFFFSPILSEAAGGI